MFLFQSSDSTLATLTATTDEVGKTVYYSLTSRTYLDIDSLTGRLYNTVVLDAEVCKKGQR